MLFTPKNSIKKFQQGGEMPVEQAPVELGAEETQDPMMMLAEAAALALLTEDCQIALQVCQGLIQMVQQMSGSLEPLGEPIFAKKGGVLLRRIRK